MISGFVYCWIAYISFCFFFFQAEDGIRDYKVTGVQTCALPISGPGPWPQGRHDAGSAQTAAPFHRDSARTPLETRSVTPVGWSHRVPEIGAQRQLSPLNCTFLHCSSNLVFHNPGMDNYLQ